MRRFSPFFERLKTSPLRQFLFQLLLCALTGLVLALVARLIDTQSLRYTLAALALGNLWLTALLLFLVHAALSLLTRSLLLGGALTALPAAILALIDHYKMAITSTPLQIGDFALAGRVGSIVELNAQSLTLSRNTALALIGACVWLVALGFCSRPVRLPWRKSLPAALAPALVLTLVVGPGANKLVYTPLQAPVSALLTQSDANEHCGVLLGLWRGVLYKIQSTPRGYSEQTMEDLLTQAQEDLPAQAASERKQPNIILILSESFFDVTTLPGVTYDSDPLAEFHALQEEGVSGAFYTRTVGYGTCDIELEILTGINTSLLSGENLYSLDPEALASLPSVPALLKENGYETVAFHLFDDSIYHRTPIYQALGIDNSYFSGDFAAIDPDAAAAKDYWAYMATKIRGGYYSDDYMTDLFLDLYEARQGDAPLFLYGLSVENHTPHDGTKYAADGYTVACTSPLSGEAAGVLADVSQGAADASQALGRLADYFREQEEPTVILFYGDHRPGLGLSDAVSSVYSALGMVPGTNQSQWTAEQLKELHSTTYLIWANDPDYLPAPAGTTRDVSTNYFGLNVLSAAGVELPLYWRILDDASSELLMDAVEYHLSLDGTPSREAASSSETQLQRLRLCFYDALYGDQYITQRLWE
jgi:phosphoglycerol transferase MdoB-like AlkP superfamily enzyme